jgi:hypothetical protein
MGNAVELNDNIDNGDDRYLTGSSSLSLFHSARGGKMEAVRQDIRSAQLTIFLRASTRMVGRFERWLL